jgi:hypothetical protein
MAAPQLLHVADGDVQQTIVETRHTVEGERFRQREDEVAERVGHLTRLRSQPHGDDRLLRAAQQAEDFAFCCYYGYYQPANSATAASLTSPSDTSVSA